MAVTATTAWLVLHHLGELPRSDTTEDGAGQHIWLYYWNHHTSTWWSALAAILGTLTSLPLGALLLRLTLRSVYARSKLGGVIVAVVGWAAWLCGAAFLGLLSLVLWSTADIEGTQTEVSGPGSTHVLVALDNTGYDNVDIWRRDTSSRYVLEPGEAEVDPRNGPCTLTRSARHLTLTCGTTSQTLEP